VLSASQVDAIDLFSKKQEVRVGEEYAPEFERDYGGVIDNPELSARVERVGRSLVAVCDRKDIEYSFKILRNEINAFALPGGKIYITKGLLDMLESDDELAYVLGHEIGHVAKKHARKRMSEAILAQFGLNALFSDPGTAGSVAINVLWALHSSGYSRNHERDADTWGVRYMMRAGYDPHGALKVLSKFMEMEKKSKGGSVPKILRSHPKPSERMKNVEKQIQKEWNPPVPPSSSQ